MILKLQEESRLISENESLIRSCGPHILCRILQNRDRFKTSRKRIKILSSLVETLAKFVEFEKADAKDYLLGNLLVLLTYLHVPQSPPAGTSDETERTRIVPFETFHALTSFVNDARVHDYEYWAEIVQHSEIHHVKDVELLEDLVKANTHTLRDHVTVDPLEERLRNILRVELSSVEEKYWKQFGRLRCELAEKYRDRYSERCLKTGREPDGALLLEYETMKKNSEERLRGPISLRQRARKLFGLGSDIKYGRISK